MNWDKKGSIYYLINSDKIKSKIASFDLDYTLIKPHKSVHPKDINDWELCFDILKEKLNYFYKNDFSLVIFSNQSSFNNPDRQKIIISRIEQFLEFINLPFHVFISTRNDFCRKPNTGMWDTLFENKEINMKESFYVGDAAGRDKNPLTNKKDFACSDRMFAENIGLKFYTPEDIFKPVKYKQIFEMRKTWDTFKKTDDTTDKIINESLKDFNVVILLGPPASGKSSLSKSLKDFTHISQDLLKYKRTCLKLMNETLQNKGRVVIDNTHSNVKSREPYLEMAKKYNEKVLCIFIDINKEQSMFLNNFRCKLTKKIKLPDVVVHTFFKKFEPPLKKEGIEQIIKKGFTPDFNKYNETLFKQYF